MKYLVIVTVSAAALALFAYKRITRSRNIDDIEEAVACADKSRDEQLEAALTEKGLAMEELYGRKMSMQDFNDSVAPIYKKWTDECTRIRDEHLNTINNL